jgi:hypothetical protein
MPQAKVIALMEKARENPSTIALGFVAITKKKHPDESLTLQERLLTVIPVTID